MGWGSGGEEVHHVSWSVKGLGYHLDEWRFERSSCSHTLGLQSLPLLRKGSPGSNSWWNYRRGVTMWIKSAPLLQSFSFKLIPPPPTPTPSPLHYLLFLFPHSQNKPFPVHMSLPNKVSPLQPASAAQPV